jgi:hypothetical protein
MFIFISRVKEFQLFLLFRLIPGVNVTKLFYVFVTDAASNQALRDWGSLQAFAAEFNTHE